jgi:hypothetical protein
MNGRPESARWRRILLGTVAAAAIASASVAVAFLLFGAFGETEGRILATTALLAVHGLLALPSAVLLDNRRRRGLAILASIAVALSLALLLAIVWAGMSEDQPVWLGKLGGTAAFWAAAGVQAAALAAWRMDEQPSPVRGLFRTACALGATLAAAITAAMWLELESQLFFRLFATGVVIDLLVVVLQPLLVAARARRARYVLRVRLVDGSARDVDVEAVSFAVAAKRAIERAHCDESRIRAVERVPARPESVVFPRCAAQTGLRASSLSKGASHGSASRRARRDR